MRHSKLLSCVGLVPVVLALTSTDVVAHGGGHGHQNRPDPVGLSLFFRDGAIQPITLVGDAERYLQEIDITHSTATGTDQGITPLIQSGPMSQLNWQGIHFVEEDWRSPGDGTFTRQRFYRGAKWMERDSTFIAIPKDVHGHLAGDPMVFLAGTDNRMKSSDDGFVRRYDVRQITLGCQAINDCSNATTFIVQGLVQSRHELDVDRRKSRISRRATQLQLIWSEDLGTNRSVALNHADPDDFDYGYGLTPTIEVVSPPTNGQYYLPGESVSFKLVFKDGQGNRLTPEGSLPTYAEFLAGTGAGIHFLDLSLTPTLYYALKHREGNMLFALSGPTSKVDNPFNTINFGDFFGPQVTVASVASEGWTGVAQVIPPLPEIIGGFQDPSLWELDNPDVRTFTIPADAEPGTYLAAIKVRREWGGEALNRGATLAIQVGSTQPTGFQAKTGNCGSCHQDRSSLSIVNHGLGDRRACFGCHASLPFEPDNALDVRVHFIHSRSERFPGNVNQCSTCHLTPPNGPPRGFPGVGF